MSDQTTEAAVVAELAERAHELETLHDGLLGAVVRHDQDIKTIDTYAMGLEDGPRRKQGAGTVYDLASLQTYVELQRTDDEVEPSIYASRERETFAALFDDHRGEQPGYGRHSMTLQMTKTADWKDVIRDSGQYYKASLFAEKIEDLRPVIAAPNTLELVEFIRAFRATKVTELEETIDEKTGDRSFKYKTSTTTNNIEVPNSFTFAVSVYEGLDPVAVEADFRYRADEGSPVQFGYFCRSVERVEREAFDTAADAVRVALPGSPFMFGSPSAG